jgi:hypothetical protein
MNPFKSFWHLAAAIFVALVIVFASIRGIQYLWRRHTAPPAITVKVNDSTTAQSTVPTTSKADLPALVDAAKTLGGKLVAGTKIKTKPETVYVVRRIAPTTISFTDSSRTATRTDTTKGYIVTIEADAPKFPAPLKLGYNIVTPSFTPEVGFVERDGSYYAVVSWAGQQTEVSKSFYQVPKTRPLALIAGADVIGTPTATVSGAAVRGRAYVGVTYTSAKKWSLELLGGSQNLSPFVGLGVRKTIW